MTDLRDLAWPVYLSTELSVPPSAGATVTLTGHEARHAATVRRHRPGEWIVLTDGAGGWVAGPVAAVRGKAEVEVDIDRWGVDAPANVRLTVVQALPKSDRADEAIEFLTAVGVDHIVPWQAQRSVARWSSERAQRGLARWQRTAREAAKQSRRVRVPGISEPVDLPALAGLLAEADLALVCHEQATTSIGEVQLPGSRGHIMIIIGPEGGVTEAELAAMSAAGAQVVSLGPTVLRTSVAGGLAAGLILAKAGRLAAAPAPVAGDRP